MLASRRFFIQTMGAVALIPSLPKVAGATTLRPLDLKELLIPGGLVGVGLPWIAECSWERFGGSRRIITKTRVVFDEVWNEGSSESETIVATLGGTVGDVAQKVAGEARLYAGKRCVLFLSPEGEHGRSVIGMGQGCFQLQGSGSSARLLATPDLHFAGRQTPSFARALLGDRTVEEARQLVQRGSR